MPVPQSHNVFGSPDDFPPSGAPLVSRIIDYESPRRGGMPGPAAGSGDLGRRPDPCPPPDENRKQTHAAATFADAALRRVLEVIDRRRPLAQLRPLLAAGLVDSLLAGAGGDGGAARLRRVRAQLTGPQGCAAEVAAHYSRGQRVHAIACRVEQVTTPTGRRWQVVALHLG